MTTNKRMIIAIMLALAIWGIYLAIGATGYFIDASLMDARKSFIVAVSMTTFLVLWVFVLRAVDNRKAALELPNTSLPPLPVQKRKEWSKAGIATLGIGGFGASIWVASIASFERVHVVTTTGLGWLAAISMIGAATSGMIALSNPRVLRGKWLGLTGLLLCAVSLICFVVRMTP